MGHSVHAVAFRLCHRRSWVHRSPFIGAVPSLWSPAVVERLVQRRLRPPQAPFLAGASLLRRSPFGASRFLVQAQFTPLQRVLALFHRRNRFKRRRAFHPLVASSLLPPAQSLPPLAPLWLPFLRSRFGTSWAPLVASPFPLRLVGVRSFPFPTLLCRFLLDRVRSGLPLGRLINSFLANNFRRLAKVGVLGVLLRASGRFTRSQLATTLLFRRGRVPLATVALAVDQVSATASLKYGACTLTLWISRSSPLLDGQTLPFWPSPAHPRQAVSPVRPQVPPNFPSGRLRPGFNRLRSPGQGSAGSGAQGGSPSSSSSGSTSCVGFSQPSPHQETAPVPHGSRQGATGQSLLLDPTGTTTFGCSGSSTGPGSPGPGRWGFQASPGYPSLPSPFSPGMIFRETLLRVADNSGARLVRCVGLTPPFAREGDLITVSVCRCRPRSRVERGRLYRALVVQCRRPSTRWGGVALGFRSNRVVLLRRPDSLRAEPLPLGTRLVRSLSLAVRRRGFAKLLLLAPSLL